MLHLHPVIQSFRIIPRIASPGAVSYSTLIKDAYKAQPGKEATIHGWVRSKRSFKDFSFVVVNDGSCVGGMQCVLKDSSAINVGSSIEVRGILKEPQSSHSKSLELHVSDYAIIGDCDLSAYPLQKKFATQEFLRSIPHIRPRTNLQLIVNRMRNSIIQSIHSTLQSNDFMQIMAPIITSNDCEGAGELFSVGVDKKGALDGVSFFNTKTFLTVSGQLQAEMLAHSLSRVYSFAPAFRAENSNTTRHLSEFWMVEPEMCFAGMNELMNLGIDVISGIGTTLLEKNMEELSFLKQHLNKDIIDTLYVLSDSKNYCYLSYTEAIEVLLKATVSFKNPVKWGIDLQSEHEKYLCEVYCKNHPLYITDYPKEIKAFYMKENEDKKTVGAYDLLVPRIGEIIGGSIREDRYSVLEEKMHKLGLLSEEYRSGRSTKALDWYLDLRRYGTTPHGGWGLGLERVIELCTGVQNIRETIPVPRVPNSCLL